MKLNLVGNQNDRNYVMESETRGTINLVELLERFGKIMDYMTESMVASFYQVPQSTIENYGSRNTQELNNLSIISCRNCSAILDSVNIIPITITACIGYNLKPLFGMLSNPSS